MRGNAANWKAINKIADSIKKRYRVIFFLKPKVVNFKENMGSSETSNTEKTNVNPSNTQKLSNTGKFSAAKGKKAIKNAFAGVANP